MITGKKEIKTLDDVIECINEIMGNFDGAWQFNHQYEQVLQIHRENVRTDNKLDQVLDKLNYLTFSDYEKKYLNSDGSTNYESIVKMCDAILQQKEKGVIE